MKQKRLTTNVIVKPRSWGDKYVFFKGAKSNVVHLCHPALDNTIVLPLCGVFCWEGHRITVQPGPDTRLCKNCYRAAQFWGDHLDEYTLAQDSDLLVDLGYCGRVRT